MTNEKLFDDLKQFIAATISQQTADLRTDIDEVKQDVKRLDHKLDQVQADIGDALTQILDALDVSMQVRDHDKRIR